MDLEGAPGLRNRFDLTSPELDGGPVPVKRTGGEIESAGPWPVVAWVVDVWSMSAWPRDDLGSTFVWDAIPV